MSRPSFLKSSIKKVQGFIVVPLAAVLIWSIYKTIRWKRNDFPLLNEKRPFLSAFWHGKQLMLAPLSSTHLPRFCASILISAHTDGRLIAGAIRWFGLGSVAGSSTRGGVAAYRSLMELLQGGQSIGITPDGPRGPIHKVKPGVIKLSQMSGIPITPVSCAASRKWQFKSWDKMFLPKPFASGVCLLGEPYLVATELDEQTAQRELERRLNELTDLAEALVNE